MEALDRKPHVSIMKGFEIILQNCSDIKSNQMVRLYKVQLPLKEDSDPVWQKTWRFQRLPLEQLYDIETDKNERSNTKLLEFYSLNSLFIQDYWNSKQLDILIQWYVKVCQKSKLWPMVFSLVRSLFYKHDKKNLFVVTTQLLT